MAYKPPTVLGLDLIQKASKSSIEDVLTDAVISAANEELTKLQSKATNYASSLISGITGKLPSFATPLIGGITATLLEGGYPDPSTLVAKSGITSINNVVNTPLISGGSLTKSISTISSVSKSASAITSGTSNTIQTSDISKTIQQATTANDFGDVQEIFLDSKYYPKETPFLARMAIQFPKSIDEKVSYKTIPGTTFVNTADLKVDKTTYTPKWSGDSNLSKEDVLEVRPQNLISFDYQRIMNGIGTFTLSLFDPGWNEIEKRITKNKGYFKFKYGYAEDLVSDTTSGVSAEEGSIVSPWYEAKAFSYRLHYGIQGTTITITGLSTGYSLTLAKEFAVRGTDSKNIGEIVTALAQSLDMIPVVEPTQPVLVQDAIDSTEAVNKLINMTGESVLQFLVVDLLKYARNKNYQGNYVFFIETTPEGKLEFHFHTPGYEPSKPGTGSPSVLDTDNPNSKPAVSSKKVPAFTMFKGGNSPLLHFSPTWDMTVAMISGGGGTIAPIIDVNSKNTVTSKTDYDSVPQQFDNKSRVMNLEPDNYVMLSKKPQPEFISFNSMFVPDRAEQAAITRAQDKVSKTLKGAIQADIEIVGTPSFRLVQKIAVIVYIPERENTTAMYDTNIHYMSGYFRIVKITESIRAGRYTTHFSLVRDGSLDPSADTVPKT